MIGKPMAHGHKPGSSWRRLRLEPLEQRRVLSFGHMPLLLSNPGTAPDPTSGFGSTAAADGNLAVVGSPYAGINGVTDVGRVDLFNARSGQLVRTIANPFPADEPNFGSVLAISGNTVVVGGGVGIYAFDATTGTLLSTLANPNPTADNGFGSAVAISGSTVVVGAPLDDTGAAGAGVAYLYNASTGEVLKTIHNPFPAADVGFGLSVAIDGTRVVVGASEDGSLLPGVGVAYVFDTTTGNRVATIANPTPAADDAFGSAVAISGNTVLVGAWGDDAQTTDGGAAYLFNATTGLLTRTLVHPAPLDNAGFGGAVALSGILAVVGSPNDLAGAGVPGAAYVYSVATGQRVLTLTNPATGDRDSFGAIVAIGSDTVLGADYDTQTVLTFDSSSGNLAARLANPTPASDDVFGGTVAIDGNRAAVASLWDDADLSDAGAVYLFDATAGTRLATLHNPTPGSLDAFGSGVSVSGDRVLVGACWNDTTLEDVGAAYLFDSGGHLLRTLAQPSPQASDEFGYATAMSGDTAAVSAPNNHGGSVYVYDATNTNAPWSLANPRSSSAGYFGASLAISGNILAVGDTDATVGAVQAGAVHLYDSSTRQLLRSIDHPAPAAGATFGHSLAIAGNLIVVGAPFDDSAHAEQGAAWVFNATTGQLVATLGEPSGAAGDHFGWSVAIEGNEVLVADAPYYQGAAQAGSVYVFRADTGALVDTLASPSPADDDQFGYSVAISSGRAIVGAPGQSGGYIHRGAAYVFEDQTHAPVADAGGPYAVAEGGSTGLEALGTTDPDLPDDQLTYAWDFDGDGQYDDAQGDEPTFTADGRNGPGMVTVGLKVTDSFGNSSTATAQVDIVNAGPTVDLDRDLGGVLGTVFSFSAQVTDPGNDAIVGLRWDFGDGTIVPNGTLTPQHEYLAEGSYTVTLTATDADGGVGTGQVRVFVGNLDVDLNGHVTGMSDGLIVLRYLFDFRGPPLVAKILGQNAQRTDPNQIAAFLASSLSTMLDIDANGRSLGMSDGIILLRYLFDFQGPPLVNNALGAGATRTDPAEVLAFLDSYMPPAAKGVSDAKSFDAAMANAGDWTSQEATIRRKFHRDLAFYQKYLS
jgi:PKD repeat protein